MNMLSTFQMCDVPVFFFSILKFSGSDSHSYIKV